MSASALREPTVRSWSNEWRTLSHEQKNMIRPFLLSAPVKISSIARAFGLEIVLSPLPARISGEIRPTSRDSGQTFIIKINRYESSVRQRFTAAHEFAHFLLHRDKIGSGIVDSVLYRSNLSNTLEAQANRLAADILMPIDLLRGIIGNRFISELLEDDISEIADTLQVSEMALQFRLGL